MMSKIIGKVLHKKLTLMSENKRNSETRPPGINREYNNFSSFFFVKKNFDTRVLHFLTLAKGKNHSRKNEKKELKFFFFNIFSFLFDLIHWLIIL